MFNYEVDYLNRIVEYKLISVDGLSEFNEAVNESIKLGFQPYGEHKIIMDRYFQQAMVKYEEE